MKGTGFEGSAQLSRQSVAQASAWQLNWASHRRSSTEAPSSWWPWTWMVAGEGDWETVEDVDDSTLQVMLGREAVF